MKRDGTGKNNKICGFKRAFTLSFCLRKVFVFGLFGSMRSESLVRNSGRLRKNEIGAVVVFGCVRKGCLR